MEKYGIDVKKLRNLHIDKDDLIRHTGMNELIIKYDLTSSEIGYIIERDYGMKHISVSAYLLREWMQINHTLTFSEMKEYLVGRTERNILLAAGEVGISFRENRKYKNTLSDFGPTNEEFNKMVYKHLQEKAPPYIRIQYFRAPSGCDHDDIIANNFSKTLFIWCNKCGHQLAQAIAHEGGPITPFDVNRIIHETKERLQGCTTIQTLQAS